MTNWVVILSGEAHPCAAPSSEIIVGMRWCPVVHRSEGVTLTRPALAVKMAQVQGYTEGISTGTREDRIWHKSCMAGAPLPLVLSVTPLYTDLCPIAPMLLIHLYWRAFLFLSLCTLHGLFSSNLQQLERALCHQNTSSGGELGHSRRSQFYLISLCWIIEVPTKVARV